MEPNVPRAVLLSQDNGEAAVALRSHPDDAGGSTIVLFTRLAIAATMGAPNDEALYTHRLYEAGYSSASSTVRRA